METTRAPTKPQGPKRLVVADDDHLIAHGLTSSLVGLGYEVVGAAPNGAVAVELCRQRRPDLALLDIRMPTMSGLEAARIIWEEARIPTIIVSAYSDEAFLDEARESGGVFGYILKPVSVESVRAAICVAWNRSSLEREQVDRISQLELNLKHRQTVEKAKWKMVEQHGMSEADAHQRLQRAARDTRRPLVELAEQVLASADLSFLPPVGSKERPAPRA